MSGSPKYTPEMLAGAARHSLSVNKLMVKLGLRLSGEGIAISRVGWRRSASRRRISSERGRIATPDASAGMPRRRPKNGLSRALQISRSLRAEHVRRALQEIG